jgi:diguanylate cyclase (GGDEF)-like protein/PAS domain S-box-containing protein
MAPEEAALRVINVEDQIDDSLLNQLELQREGMRVEWMRVDSREDFVARLADFSPDIILSDYSIPGFSGYAALEIAQQSAPLVPFIFVSGTIGEERAIESLKRGAIDYVLKGNLKRLLPAIQRALSDQRRVAALSEVEQQFRSAFLNAAVGMALGDGNGKIIRVNRAYSNITGYSEAELLGRFFWTSTFDEDIPAAIKDVAALRGNMNDSFVSTCRIKRKSGDIAWVQNSVSAVRSPNGAVTHIIGLFEDITARTHAVHALMLMDRSFRSSTNGIMIVSNEPSGYPIERVNPALGELLGTTDGALLGQLASEALKLFFNIDDLRLMTARMRAASEASSIIRILPNATRTERWCDLRISPVRNASNEITHFIGIFSDITESKRYQSQLEHQETHDDLTALANRVVFTDRLNTAIDRSSRDDDIVLVAHLGLDQFKLVNEAFGHMAGDQVLQVIANRLTNSCPPGTTIARFGGDEFILIFEGPDTESWIETTVVNLQQQVITPVPMAGQDLIVSCSAGLAIYPRDGKQSADLLHAAEMALYRAKEQRRGSYQFFTSALNARLEQRGFLHRNLKNGIDKQEFELYYQPQVDLRTNRIAGAEALIRWNHPAKGLIPPSDFIPAAEESGLIIPMGTWVIEEACRQLALWRDGPLGGLHISVNLAAGQMKDDTVKKIIIDALDRAGADPRLLGLEITESQLMANPEQVTALLTELRARGTRISIDDFGTGYSSLGYLKRLPVDVLKIDRIFIKDLPGGPEDVLMASAIISLAHSMGIEVVAEGVETVEQLEFMYERSCEYIQGYYYSKPLKVAGFEAYVLNWNATHV